MSKKEAQPMDDKIKEVRNPVPATNKQRVCWALKTLVAEFTELFPETPVEYSNYDGRNTALDVTFDLTMLMDGADRALAEELLHLLDHGIGSPDARVSQIIEEDDRVLVSMRPGPRTQDSREPFNLNDAYMVLIEDAEYGSGDGS